jgi:hypothetical protein
MQPDSEYPRIVACARCNRDKWYEASEPLCWFCRQVDQAAERRRKAAPPTGEETEG